MRRTAYAAGILTACGLALAGCASIPEVVRDESGFIEVSRSLAGNDADMFADAELVEHGDAVCEMARSSEEKLSDGLTYLDNLVSTEDGAAARDYWAAVSAAAGTFLCQDVA